MGTRLTFGLSEDRDFRWPRIPFSKFNDSGPYRSAIFRLNKLLDSTSAASIYSVYWQRCLSSGSTLPAATKEEAVERLKADVKWIAITEAESARIWSEGPRDFRSQMRAHQTASQSDIKRLKATLEELRRYDSRHAYLLRFSLERALQDFLSDEAPRRVKSPDPNTKHGYTWKTVSGPVVRENEFQFLSRLALFEFSEMLNAWDREIDFMFKPWPVNWMEFGALRFEKPITPKAAAKMNVVQLGLLARLASRLRDFTAGYGIWSYGTGQPVPDHGKPCWDIVAEFVNCAFPTNAPLTGETARRTWQKFVAKHPVRLQGWPKPGKSEPQVQKT